MKKTKVFHTTSTPVESKLDDSVSDDSDSDDSDSDDSNSNDELDNSEVRGPVSDVNKAKENPELLQQVKELLDDKECIKKIMEK